MMLAFFEKQFSSRYSSIKASIVKEAVNNYPETMFSTYSKSIESLWKDPELPFST